LLKEFILIIITTLLRFMPVIIPASSLFNLMKNIPKNHLLNWLTKIAYIFGLIKLFGTKN